MAKNKEIGGVLRELSELEKSQVLKVKKEIAATRQKLQKMKDDFESKLMGQEEEFKKNREEAIGKATIEAEKEAKKFFSDYQKQINELERKFGLKSETAKEKAIGLLLE